ncbi:MAG: N-acetylmuramoyl-L-alanine amidase [Akkermansia sp.]
MCALASCSSGPSTPRSAPMVSFRATSTPLVERSTSTLAREVNVQKMILPSSNRERRRSFAMNPKFITVHSTQNKSADAVQHAHALMNGALRHDWHFTIDPRVAIQHIPLNESGRHADSGRTGDRFSIGIEMCEKRGDSLVATFDRTAKQIAVLMDEYNIPLRNVVPHYYWTRKNCPIILMDGARPGFKWSWFISRVDYYYRCTHNGRSAL